MRTSSPDSVASRLAFAFVRLFPPAYFLPDDFIKMYFGEMQRLTAEGGGVEDKWKLGSNR